MKNKIILISQDTIGSQMAGPGLRYWNFAKELSKCFEVVLFCPNQTDLKATFQIERFDKRTIIKYASNSSCIILQGTLLWRFPQLKKLRIPIVVDIYDPFILENLEVNKNDPDADKLHKASLSILIDQLKFGDFFICASEKQRDFWIGMLASINRVNSLEYSKSKDLRHLIDTVPFGYENESPQKDKQVIKGIVPGVAIDDKVIIWGGGIWDWLDPKTAIHAMNKVSQIRTDMKLFFAGTKRPGEFFESDSVADARKLSDSLGLTNRYVFFNEWMPFAERHNYLLESDIGISLHFDNLETRFSFRTRMLDYIWSKLPIICTSGDLMSELVEKNGIGIAVQPGDPDGLAEALIAFDKRSNFAEAFNCLSSDLKWSKVVEPLVQFCQEPMLSHGKKEAFKVSTYNKFIFSWVKSYAYLRKRGLRQLLKRINTYNQFK